MRLKTHAVPLAVAALLSLSCGAELRGQDAGRGIDLRVPDSIGAFRRIQRKDFEDPSQGVMLRYRRADSLTADLFVYPGPDLAKKCDLACAREVLKREGDDFAQVFPEMIRRGYVDTISVASDSALTPDSAASWRLGRHMRFLERQGGQPRWSDLYVYYLPGFRLKVRATYLPEPALAAGIAQFAASAVPAVTGPPPASSDDGSLDGLAMSTTVPGPLAVHYARVLRLLAERGFAIEDSSLTAGRIVTAPSYAWPPGSEKEEWHGTDSPGVRLAVALTAKGDSTTVEVGGQSPTKADWKDSKVASTLRLLSIMQLLSAIPEEKDKGKARR
jgi:hypothetical protein